MDIIEAMSPYKGVIKIRLFGVGERWSHIGHIKDIHRLFPDLEEKIKLAGE